MTKLAFVRLESIHPHKIVYTPEKTDDTRPVWVEIALGTSKEEALDLLRRVLVAVEQDYTAQRQPTDDGVNYLVGGSEANRLTDETADRVVRGRVLTAIAAQPRTVRDISREFDISRLRVGRAANAMCDEGATHWRHNPANRQEPLLEAVRAAIESPDE